MLGIVRLSGPSPEYYVGRSRNDGARGEEPVVGRWWGRAAPGIGCRGAVGPDELGAVLAGGRADGRPLAQRRPVTAAGYDLTFSAPKSVSVAWAIGSDRHRDALWAAHRVAVDAAMTYVEERAVAVRRGSGPERRLLGVHGVVAAAFDHGESRTGDPHLHTHVVTANLVQAEDGRWSAIDGRGLYAHGPAAGRLYQAQLRHEVTARTGLAWVRHSADHCELEVVGPELRGVFSGRQADIRAALAGRTGRAASRVAWAATRPPKGPAGTDEDRRVGWLARAADVGWTWELGRLGDGRTGPPVLDEQAFARALVRDRPTALYRRDGVAAWSDGLVAGAPAAAVRAAVDRWLGPGDGPGVGERRRVAAELVPAAHLLVALGPRPTTAAGLETWCRGARAVEDYRHRFGVADRTDPVGAGAPGLATLTPARLAAHLRVTGQIDETRRRLGRPPWRELDGVTLERGRG